MTIKELLTQTEKKLKDSCERPRFEAELLLAYHLKKERTYLHAFDDHQVQKIEQFDALVARRANHEPYEYIVGEASFYDLSLAVERGVLIPRPETEILIDLVAKIIEREKIEIIAEIGIGSGAISVVLARKFPHLKILATDISELPIRVAYQNIRRFGVEDQITLIHSNLLDKVDTSVELIISNPPYIAEDFLLASNVVDYEPKEALFGGVVGDELLKKIVMDAQRRNVRYLACEMGYDQKAPMEQFFREIGIKSYKFYQDLAKFDRGFVITF
jgi:release factor glutamine methyltransferase